MRKDISSATTVSSLSMTAACILTILVPLVLEAGNTPVTPSATSPQVAEPAMITLYSNTGNNTNGFNKVFGDPTSTFLSDGTNIIGSDGQQWTTLPVSVDGTKNYEIEYDFFGGSDDAGGHILMVNNSTYAGLEADDDYYGNLIIIQSTNFDSEDTTYPSSGEILTSASAINFDYVGGWTRNVVNKSGSILYHTFDGQTVSANLTNITLLPSTQVGIGYFAADAGEGDGYVEYRNIKVLVQDQITRDGQPINATNNTVCVGQQINLTNVISGTNTLSPISYQWNIPGATNGTAFYDYEPNARNSCYTNLLTPTNYTTNSYCNFYWFAAGTNQVSCTTVINGQTNTVSATLNVSRPYAGVTANITGPIAVGTNYASADPNITNWLYFGANIGTNNGVTFTETNSPTPGGFTGQFRYVQTASLAITNSPSSYPGTPATVLSPSGTNIDTTFPYDYPNSAGIVAYDSPADPYLFSATRSSSEHFQATMYLFWQANSTNSAVNGDKTVWVPIRGVNWSWSGAATNSAAGTTNAAMWTLVSGSTNYPPNLNDFPVTNAVQWSQNITNFIYTY